MSKKRKGGDKMVSGNKIAQGNAAQLLVASELNRRGWSAAVTLGNTPHVDILCSNQDGTRFAFVQVKSFHAKDKSCAVGKKAENSYGENFFWVIVGLSGDEYQKDDFYIVPASAMSYNVRVLHDKWLRTPGKIGQQHKDNSIRNVHVGKSRFDYDICQWKDRWDLIGNVMR
jgi:hypothetical protein